MIKLYIPYFLYGIIIFYMNLFIWGFSAGASNIMPYITLISSIILFAIASGLSLFYVKVSSIIGLISLLGASPFGYYLVSQMGFTDAKIFDLIILVAISSFISGVFYSLKILINKSVVLTSISKPVRLIMAVIPLALFLLWFAALFLRLM